jgi:hypothetical protein
VTGRPQVFAAALCGGLMLANLARVGVVAVLVLSLLVVPLPRALSLALALLLAGWWLGSVRLNELDRSVLAGRVGEAGRAVVVVTGQPRPGRFEQRAPGVVTRFAGARVREPVRLELPPGRAPPQGAVLDVLTVIKRPRGAEHGFDERTWLRHRGVHVVLHVDEWHANGRRGGLGGVADALRRRLQRSVALGLRGERAGVVEESCSATTAVCRTSSATTSVRPVSITCSLFRVRTSCCWWEAWSDSRGCWPCRG